jgi:hypothetical protein
MIDLFTAPVNPHRDARQIAAFAHADSAMVAQTAI